MSIWSFGATPSEFSTLTIAQAKKLVVRPIGGTDNPDEHGASDALRMAIDELNRHRWEFLTVKGSDINLVADQSTYDLPTPFKDPVSLLTEISGEKRSLTYVPRGTWDPLVGSESVGGTWFYTNFAQGLTSKIELLDPPGSAGTMELRYYRPIQIPTNDETGTLDVLEGPIERALLARAQWWVALWKGLRSERLQMLQQEAYRALREARGDDVSHPDFKPQFVPGRIWGGNRINNNSPYPDRWGW